VEGFFLRKLYIKINCSICRGRGFGCPYCNLGKTHIEATDEKVLDHIYNLPRKEMEKIYEIVKKKLDK